MLDALAVEHLLEEFVSPAVLRHLVDDHIAVAAISWARINCYEADDHLSRPISRAMSTSVCAPAIVSSKPWKKSSLEKPTCMSV